MQFNHSSATRFWQVILVYINTPVLLNKVKHYLLCKCYQPTNKICRLSIREVGLSEEGHCVRERLEQKDPAVFSLRLPPCATEWYL